MGTKLFGAGPLLPCPQASPSQAQSWQAGGWGASSPTPSPGRRSRLPPRVCCPVPKEDKGGLDLFSRSLSHFTEISYFLEESVNYTRGTIK